MLRPTLFWLAPLLGLALLPLPMRAESLFLTGQLTLCQSDRMTHCQRTAIDPLQLRSAYRGPQLSLSESTLAQLDGPVLGLSPDALTAMRLGLRAIAEELGDPDLSAEAFWQTLEPEPKWLTSLNGAQRLWLQDALERPQTDRYGTRKRATAWPSAGHTPATERVIERLISRLKQRQSKPTLVVMSSGNRDPFAASDAVLSLFADADITVHWLPLDASLQAARQAHQCHKLEQYRQQVQGNLNRQRLYPKRVAYQQQVCLQPELAMHWLDKADGIYIADGAADLVRASLMTAEGEATPDLKRVLQRFMNDDLLLAASGGAASALVELLSESVESWQDSELETQPVLTGLLMTGTVNQLAIEANTALRIDAGEWQVVGEGGVWLYQRQHQLNHFLQAGDRARGAPSALTVHLAHPRVKEQDQQDAPLVLPLDEAALLMPTDALCHSTQQQALGQFEAGTAPMGAVWTVTEASQFGVTDGGRCSYHHIKLEVGVVGTPQSP
ncbi:hypothetical protein [Ferrimonas balearica]|uniref:hypothetical protein n=1 Tax=Ferrimonas balearica TaxID=44012 RepID=UPI001C9A21C8|nr:hypothetical protein [Ferrimonas balearica]MBY5920767.1 hypothetical protein [Ferrimonas balearica]MBY5996548.1 hypothetical protein [Ferrimonas balearica]